MVVATPVFLNPRNTAADNSYSPASDASPDQFIDDAHSGGRQSVYASLVVLLQIPYRERSRNKLLMWSTYPGLWSVRRESALLAKHAKKAATKSYHIADIVPVEEFSVPTSMLLLRAPRDPNASHHRSPVQALKFHSLQAHSRLRTQPAHFLAWRIVSSLIYIIYLAPLLGLFLRCAINTSEAFTAGSPLYRKNCFSKLLPPI